MNQNDLCDLKDIYHQGYYITGKLNSSIYYDDYLFDGPNPDMPVCRLRKYLSAASKLFDHKKSYADLLDLKINHSKWIIIVYWKISGILILLCKPKVKPYTGHTKYYLNEHSLIYLYKENWDISVTQAFLSTILPQVAVRIWPDIII